MTMLRDLRVWLLCTLACVLMGCGDTPATNTETTPAEGDAAAKTGTADAAPKTVKASNEKESKGDDKPKFDVSAVLAKVEAHLNAGELDQAVDALGQIEKLGSSAEGVAPKIEALRGKLDEKLAVQAAKRRDERLKQSVELVAAGKLEEATLSLDDLLKLIPTEKERAKIDSLRRQIEDLRRRRRELGVAMQLLASDQPTDIRGARSKLTADPEAAIPVVGEAVGSSDPRLAQNALEMLRTFNAPERTLPYVVGVFARKDLAALWPVATKELQKVNAPGAGPQLLALLSKIQDSAQRTAILSALSVVNDPPAQTVTALLPEIFKDSPELPAVLRAAMRAIVVHGQYDLTSLREVPDEGAANFQQQFVDLPARLDALAKLNPPTDASRAAQQFGVVARLLAAEPFTGVKVLRSSAEIPESPAAAALDGVWNKVDPKTMWRHPVDKPATLVLDLGSERTVTALKLWNFNETGAAHRGWKEVDVYVSNTPASLTPVAKGIVLKAPALADTVDYGTVISVPCVRGRYIRLECRSLWQVDVSAGLSEIQVLGF